MWAICKWKPRPSQYISLDAEISCWFLPALGPVPCCGSVKATASGKWATPHGICVLWVLLNLISLTLALLA